MTWGHVRDLLSILLSILYRFLESGRNVGWARMTPFPTTEYGISSEDDGEIHRLDPKFAN
jgi:hypothetical protein